MQQRWLKDFERYLDALMWSKAQDLVHAGAVQGLRELERHFWDGRVADGDRVYEVEVMLTPNKIKAYTCSCWSSASRQLMCVHIAAMLLRIRHFLSSRQAAKVAAPDPDVVKRSPDAFRISQLLADADVDALRSFVLAYARDDRQFGQALRIWHAGWYAGEGNAFARALDRALPGKSAGRVVRSVELRFFKKSLDGVVEAMEARVLDGDYVRALSAAEAVMSRVLDLQGRLDEGLFLSLQGVIEAVARQVLGWEDEQLSPALRRERRDLLTRWYMHDGMPVGLRGGILTFLSGQVTDESYFRELQALSLGDSMGVHGFRLLLVAMAKRGLPEAMVRWMEESGQPVAELSQHIRFLQQEGYTDASAWTARHFLQHLEPGAPGRTALEDIVLASSDREAATAILQHRYRRHPGPQHLGPLKESVSSDAWSAVRDGLLRHWVEVGKQDAWLDLMRQEGMQEALADALSGSSDLSVLLKYQDGVLPRYADVIADRYMCLIDQHLQQHFGLQGLSVVRRIVSGLLTGGHHELALTVVRRVVRRYPERVSIPDELAEMFPKVQQRAVLNQLTIELKNTLKDAG
jgi:hypothetical protein